MYFLNKKTTSDQSSNDSSISPAEVICLQITRKAEVEAYLKCEFWAHLRISGSESLKREWRTEVGQGFAFYNKLCKVILKHS